MSRSSLPDDSRRRHPTNKAALDGVPEDADVLENNHRVEESDVEDDSPTSPIDELLVSYLDDELDEQQKTEIEERLLGEETLRTRLTELQSGWEMLDALPPANVNEDFARTTVELVARNESTSLHVRRRSQPWKRLGWMAIVLAATATCGLVGYAIPVQVKNREYRQKLDLLPIAEHLDAYLVNIDLEIVAKLATDQTWQESMQLANESGGIAKPVSLDLAQREPEKRLEVIKNAPRDVRAGIFTNWERLLSLSEERLTGVIERAAAIRDMQNPSLILATLENYSSWWQQLSPRAQDQIIKAEGTEKLNAIQQEVRRSSRRWVRNFALMLGEADRIPIQQQLLMIADDRINLAKELTDQLSGQGVIPFAREDAPWRNITPEQLLDMLANGPRFPAQPNTDQKPSDGRRIFQTFFRPFTDSELALIEDLLSRQALAILYAESDSPDERREILSSWCMEIIQSNSSNSFESLLSRYQLFSDEQRREALDLSQPDRLINELRGRRGPGPSRSH